MKIMCGDENCSSRNRPIPMKFKESQLLKIGESYKCPYCRNDKFILIGEKLKNGKKDTLRVK